MADEEVALHVPTDFHDVDQAWENLSAGLKAGAMRYLYEEQQKLVIELQRQIMEKSAEIARGIVRAKAAQELKQDDVREQIIETELVPKQREVEELERQADEGRQLLDAFSRIGRGII